MNENVARNGLWLSLGALISQIAMVLAAPIISRLFTPQEMGLYTTYIAILGIFSVVSSLHYELALPLPKTFKQARVVLWLCHAVLLIVCVSFFTGYLLLQKRIEAALGINEKLNLQLWLPGVLFLSGALSIWTFWSVRQNQFLVNGISRAMQGIMQSVTQIAGGLIGMGVAGLIIGQAFGLCVALIILLPPVRLDLLGIFSKTERLKIYGVARRYRNFALASSPSSLVNALSFNLPPLFLIYFFDSSVVGLFGLGMRLLLIPGRLMGQAFSQSFLAEAVIALRKNRLPKLTDRFFCALYSAGLWSFLPLAVGAPAVFKFVFGPEWSGAGNYAQLLTPWLIAGFSVTPLAMLVTVLEKQKKELLLQVLYFIITASALLIGGLMQSDKLAILLLSIGGSVFFAFKIQWLLGIAGTSARTSMRFVIRETILAFGVSCLLLATCQFSKNDIIELLLISITVVIAHIVNFRFRKIYAI